MLIAMAVHDTIENNRTWMTKETLLSLKETVDWRKHRLIVSDNGSCDATMDVYGGLDNLVLLNGENIGTAAAINRAWRFRNPGEHCVKMDNDVVIHRAGWADWMEDVFDRDPSIGICGLKREDLEDAGTIRMLPHRKGQRWLVVEDVDGMIGTCQAYSSALLDKIGYLTQPGVYGFDDALSGIRARLAGFGLAFLIGIMIDHLDPGGDDYCQWKIDQANEHWARFNTEQVLLESGAKNVYYDGGFDV